MKGSDVFYFVSFGFRGEKGNQKSQKETQIPNKGEALKSHQFSP
jgi:hypothetical protein